MSSRCSSHSSQRWARTRPSSKRFSPLLFMRSQDFVDALDLFRLRCMARGQGWDVYEAWLARYQRAQEATEEELEVARRKRRRRRRPRKRGPKTPPSGS